MIQPIKPEKRGRGRPRKEIKKTAPITIWVEPYLKSLYNQKKISPEDIRNFIKNYGKPEEITEEYIKSDEWQLLLKVIKEVPALQLCGQISSGKSFLMKKAIENSKDLIFLVIDSHGEYDLPEIKTITRDITQSSRIIPPKQTEAAKKMFTIYKNIILSEPFKPNYALVIEESQRYGSQAAEICRESRKFIKTVLIQQEKTYDFCPHVMVRPYNTVDIKKIIGGKENGE